MGLYSKKSQYWNISHKQGRGRLTALKTSPKVSRAAITPSNTWSLCCLFPACNGSRKHAAQSHERYLAIWLTQIPVPVVPGAVSRARAFSGVQLALEPVEGRTQAGIPDDCNKWVMQKDGTYCRDMADAAGISLVCLYEMNPALNTKKGECQGLLTGDAYCIGTTSNKCK